LGECFRNDCGEQLFLDLNGFGYHGTRAAGTGESSDRRQQKDKKDSPIAMAQL
jgi:hypothetical protein